MVALGGIAGCSGDDSGTATPTSDDPTTTPESTPTETPEETQTREDTPEETATPEPVDVDNIPGPAQGLETYEQRLEEAAGENGEPMFSTDEIVSALEGSGSDPHQQAEHLAENLIGGNIGDQAVENRTYQLGHSLYCNRYILSSFTGPGSCRS